MDNVTAIIVRISGLGESAVQVAHYSFITHLPLYRAAPVASDNSRTGRVLRVGATFPGQLMCVCAGPD